MRLIFFCEYSSHDVLCRSISRLVAWRFSYRRQKTCRLYFWWSHLGQEKRRGVWWTKSSNVVGRNFILVCTEGILAKDLSTTNHTLYKTSLNAERSRSLHKDQLLSTWIASRGKNLEVFKRQEWVVKKKIAANLPESSPAAIFRSAKAFFNYTMRKVNSNANNKWKDGFICKAIVVGLYS